ncbi:MAG: addiction module protein [Saprospiraceae bacterium]|nr:addiction module protein [Saprospiraceae bacterium]MCF8252188.1 addiction module protein [Saprospiraceae bacterium]MCF8281559.1 addiction module protein [Bacteroidales bacterium]MCF8313857.1 addiction module protein [Saprospiraceae bacterium]MCF8442551.1 addiction module protein [Saprospiraceae bacterium]
MSATTLKEEVRKLSAVERILFVQYILDTLREDAGESELSEEWKQELDRRTASYLNGTAKTYTWEEVRNKVLQQ